jgi:hypothetical protein
MLNELRFFVELHCSKVSSKPRFNGVID